MKKIILIVLFINSCLMAYNQVIKGTILDKNDKSPIPMASIYFNGTFVWTRSDLQGKFELDISKNTSMPLSISSIGYYSVSMKITSTGKPLLIYMTPRVYEVSEVVIASKSLAKKRRANLILFTDVFLGTTENANKCEIVNKSDITFNYDSDIDTLKAFASKPLIINNLGLGYKITYYLDKFEYYKKDSTFLYAGSVVFNEDLISDEAHREVYDRRRRNSYIGSRMHFFRTLWANDLKSTGFTVKNSNNELVDYKDIVEDSLPDSTISHTKYLKYSENLRVLYYKRLTKIIFYKDKLSFERDGYFDQSRENIKWEGEMAQQRVGDMLPYSY